MLYACHNWLWTLYQTTMIFIVYVLTIFNTGKAHLVETYRFSKSPFVKQFSLFSFHFLRTALSQSLTNTIHKTQAAAEKHNDMWCYSCHSMEDGDICIDNITANYSSFMKKCKDDEYICMVKKFSYTTSTENATSGPKMWSLERRCASSCESGCIVIGERTKLYACTSCCNASYCNSGKGSGTKLMATNVFAIIGATLGPLFVRHLCMAYNTVAFFYKTWRKYLWFHACVDTF